MATFQVIKTSKGKQEVIAEGNRPKMLDLLRQLRNSTKGKQYGRGGGHRVEYVLREK